MSARPIMSVVFRSKSRLALRQLAIADDGLALLPDWLVESEVSRRALRIVLPGWRTEAVTAYAMHRIELRGAPRVRVFIDYLREALGKKVVTIATATFP